MDTAATIIVNPTAGWGRAARRWAALEPELEAFSPPPTVHATGGPGDAVELARQAVLGGSGLVVAVGGDGTAHECVQGLLSAPDSGRRASQGGAQERQGSRRREKAQSSSSRQIGSRPSVADGRGEGERSGRGGPVFSSPTRFAYVPVGTGCDFAISLGLPRAAAGLLASLPGGRDLAIDVGFVEVRRDGGTARRYFLNAANVGLGPAVARRVADSRWLRRWGTPAYLLAAGAELLRARPQRLRWRSDSGESGDGMVLNLSVCNGPSFGGGMRPCPEARLDSGRLHVALVEPLGRLAALRQMPKLMRGERIEHPALHFFTCTELQLDGSSAVETDGEVDGTLPARIGVEPAALIVRLPR